MIIAWLPRMSRQMTWPDVTKPCDSLIEYVRSYDDVWVTSLANIAKHVRGLGLTPRSVERPNPADF